MSDNFQHLHYLVQRWVYQQGWPELWDIQEQAIPPIMSHDTDVIISSTTATGKTEAAFLPACSFIANLTEEGVKILYISPLKALINDQYRRLESLAALLDLPLIPWHGDIGTSLKQRLQRQPSGIIMITPESLESLLLNQFPWCQRALSNLNYIIIDEFHDFLGQERGSQLQSLLHRIEFFAGKVIPRVALSATFSNLQQVELYLRPEGNFPCATIINRQQCTTLKLQLKGYVGPGQHTAMQQIYQDLFRILRGKTNLIFANSRKLTEDLVVALNNLCQQHQVPQEFFPHHGNLAKDYRLSVEQRLQEELLPTTAVCTATLELGVDIGKVESVAQVTHPISVSSLRQRLGRSGRRDHCPILRLFIPEIQLQEHNMPLDRLRIATLQSIAMTNLLLQQWYEPPREPQYHLSTLVQQTLSTIGQYGSVRPKQLWWLLCQTGPFKLITQSIYASFLRDLGEHQLIVQTHDGQLVLGHKGERLVGYYGFFTAFQNPQEYRLVYQGATIGSLSLPRQLRFDRPITFSGKCWKIVAIDHDHRVVTLDKSTEGAAPHFDGYDPPVYDEVRQEMLRLYLKKDLPTYADATALQLLQEGRKNFRDLGLAQQPMVSLPRSGDMAIYLFPWLGDITTNTITAFLSLNDLKATCFRGIIEIPRASILQLKQTLTRILEHPKPQPLALMRFVYDVDMDKFDIYLSSELKGMAYTEKYLDIPAAWQWLRQLYTKLFSS